jgi:hypothetical protein
MEIDMKSIRICLGMLLGMAALSSLADTCATTPTFSATAGDAGVTDNGGIFYRGQLDSLNYLNINPGAFPQNPGGTVTSEPSALSNGLNGGVAYARGSNGELWEITSDGIWTSLGGQITWNPYAVNSSAGTRRMVFYRGTNKEIWYRERISGTWGPHTSLGGVATSSPVAVSWRDNDHVAVFKRGQDNGIWYRERNAGVWTNWISLGGSSSVDPVVVTHGIGTYAIFVANGNGLVSWNKYNGVWSGWTSLGAPASGARGEPGAVATQNGGFAVFVRDNSARLIHKNTSIDGGVTWSQWLPIMGSWNTAVSNPEAGVYGGGYLVAASMTNNNVGPMQYCWGTP